MKICQECKFEYDENEEKCPRCASRVTDDKNFEKDWLVLTTVANDIEFGMVEGLLQMGNIPVVKKLKGIDGFMKVILGVPMAGIDVLVHKDRFEEAYNLLHSEPQEDTDSIEDK